MVCPHSLSPPLQLRSFSRCVPVILSHVHVLLSRGITLMSFMNYVLTFSVASFTEPLSLLLPVLPVFYLLGQSVRNTDAYAHTNDTLRATFVAYCDKPFLKIFFSRIKLPS